jgi:transcription-repair coupling factor (superfamily II helicase)
VNNAHRFGLAQLYQLRGRVGRSGQRAYAYLLYPPERALTEKADKRLEVIGDLQDLGAGFTLAMRDLEIRGAGNLLGEEQSGDIAAVGLELYTHLLNQAVTTLRGKPVIESPSQVAVSLPVTAFLPAIYISDERLRLRCYRDLAGCATEAELEAGAESLADRFGPLPDQTVALVFSLRIRLLASACGATAVETDHERITIQLTAGHGLDLEAVARQFRSWLTTSATRMYLVNPGGRGMRSAGLTGTVEWQDVLMRTLRELGRMARARQRVAELASAR